MSQGGRPETPRRAAAPIVIDGVATVLARRPLPVPPAAAFVPEPPAGAARAEAEAAAPRAFGRRSAHRRPPERDLIFQGAAGLSFGAPRGARNPADGPSLFGRGAARPRRMAAAAAALVLLALPAGLVAAPLGSAVATPSPGAGPALVIDELVTSIRPRGEGAVLSVEGLIRNVSAGPASIPPLSVALAEAGGERRTKALATGAGPLAAGRALRFHSTVAVAKGTRGAIAVEFVAAPPASGKTLIE